MTNEAWNRGCLDGKVTCTYRGQRQGKDGLGPTGPKARTAERYSDIPAPDFVLEISKTDSSVGWSNR